MKKILAVLGLLALVLPAVAFGAEINVKTPYFLDKGQTLSTNLYYAGQSAFISGDVTGDVVSVAGNINITGNVTGSVLALGGTIDILGNVTGSVRAAGGTINVSGKVDGDLVVAGGQVNILPSATIGGDLLLAGGQAVIQGNINGKIKSAARMVNINSEVKGPADINVENLTLGPKAIFDGGLTYHSYTEAQIDPAAKINGGVNFDQKQASRADNNWMVGAALGWSLISVLMLLVLGLFFGLIFRKSSHAVVHGALTDFGMNIGRGFVFLVVIPVLAFLLLFTVIGIPLAVMMMVLYVFLLALGYVYAVLLAGAWIEKYFLKKELAVSWHMILFGAVLFLILSWIPFIGWIIEFLLFLSAFGSLVGLWKQTWWAERA